MTCLIMGLSAPELSANQSVWLEYLDGPSGMIPFQGTESPMPWTSDIPDGLGVPPAAGRSRLLGPARPAAPARNVTVNLPGWDESGLGTVRVRAAMFEPNPLCPPIDIPRFHRESFPNFEFRWPGVGSTPIGGTVPSGPESPPPGSSDGTHRACEELLAMRGASFVYDVHEEFGTILREVGWSAGYLTDQFVAQHTPWFLHPTLWDDTPFRYLLDTFGEDALAAAFAPDVVEWMRPREDGQQEAYWDLARLALAFDEQGWVELLRPRPGVDAYWGLRAVAEHSGLRTRPRRLSRSSAGHWRSSAGSGTLVPFRAYVLPQATYTVRQFATDEALPYHGPPPMYLEVPPAHRARHWDTDPENRYGWPRISFFGGRDWLLEGCGSTIVFDAGSEYLRQAWRDSADDLPFCSKYHTRVPDDGAPTELEIKMIPIVSPQSIVVSNSNDFTVRDLNFIFATEAYTEGGRERYRLFSDAEFPQIHRPGVALELPGFTLWEEDIQEGLWRTESADGVGLAGRDFRLLGNCEGKPSVLQSIPESMRATLPVELRLAGGPWFELANARRGLVERVTSRGGFAGIEVGGEDGGGFPTLQGNAHPATLTVDELGFGQDRVIWASSFPGLDWFPSTTLARESSLCAGDCLSVDIVVRDSAFNDSAATGVFPNYLRRGVFDRIRAQRSGARHLAADIASNGLNFEPNNSRSLPRVLANHDALERTTGPGACERMRPGDVTVINSSLTVGSLSQVFTLNASWGPLEDVRIIRSDLIGSESSSKGALLSGAARIDVVDSYIVAPFHPDAQGNRLGIWTDGGDGLFVGNTVIVYGDVMFGSPPRAPDAMLDCIPGAGGDCVPGCDPTPGGSCSECAAGTAAMCRARQLALRGCATQAALGWDASSMEPEPDWASFVPSGPSPFVDCRQHFALSVADYARLQRRPLTADELAAGSGLVDRIEVLSTVPVHLRLGYDVAWPALGRRAPLRVVEGNTFFVGMWHRIKADGSGVCAGTAFNLAADIVRDNVVRVAYRQNGGIPFESSACSGVPAVLDSCVARMMAPVVRGFATGNTCTMQTDGFLGSAPAPVAFGPPGVAATGACVEGTARCLNRDCSQCWSDEAVDEWSWRMPQEGGEGWDADDARLGREALEEIYELRLAENTAAASDATQLPETQFSGTPKLCVEEQ